MTAHARRSTPGERALRRARFALLAACGLAAGLVVTQLPLSELLSQRGQLRTAGRQLAVLDQRNAALHAENAALRQPGTVAAIAHQEYGLVRPGQQAYVILPQAGDAAEGTLGTPAISRAQMLAGSAAALTGISPAGSGGTSPANGAGTLLSRTLDRLEFWRWAF